MRARRGRITRGELFGEGRTQEIITSGAQFGGAHGALHLRGKHPARRGSRSTTPLLANGGAPGARSRGRPWRVWRAGGRRRNRGTDRLRRVIRRGVFFEIFWPIRQLARSARGYSFVNACFSEISVCALDPGCKTRITRITISHKLFQRLSQIDRITLSADRITQSMDLPEPASSAPGGGAPSARAGAASPPSRTRSRRAAPSRPRGSRATRSACGGFLVAPRALRYGDPRGRRASPVPFRVACLWRASVA